LAHTTSKQGEVLIRNFTNIETNKLLVDVTAKSRQQSLNMFYRPTGSIKSWRRGDTADEKEEEIQKEIKIDAHEGSKPVLTEMYRSSV
jgi:hypothetical protein